VAAMTPTSSTAAGVAGKLRTEQLASGASHIPFIVSSVVNFFSPSQLSCASIDSLLALPKQFTIFLVTVGCSNLDPVILLFQTPLPISHHGGQ
jgi:hypothetical protein